MNDYERIQECLKIIQKYGDLYDVIALKEGVKLEQETPSASNLIRANVLLFSRILYSGILVYDKIKSLLSPIKKVEEASDKIREILGLNVDIIKPKSSLCSCFDIRIQKFVYVKMSLAILYENEKANIQEYVSSLKKILQFSELHQLKIIFLKETDIMSLFTEIDLDEYLHVSRNDILNCNKKGFFLYNLDESYDVKTEMYSEFLCLDLKELKDLITQLETLKIDKKMILSLSKNIQDCIIKRAITQFLFSYDLKKLKTVVKKRLTDIINSAACYKDATHGKVYQKVEIKGKYISVTSINSKGEQIEQFVTTLYDYLEVLDDSHLLKKANFKNDEQEKIRILALYLYLFQEVKSDRKENLKEASFYDYVFKKYEEKRKHKIKKIPGLYQEKEKLLNTISRIFFGFCMTAILVLSLLLGTVTIDIVGHYCFGREQGVYENVLETMITPYIKSVQYEWELGNKIFGKIRTFLPELKFNNTGKNRFKSNSEDLFSAVSKTGDVEEFGDEKEIIATVFPLSLNTLMPKYYATSYATSALYDNGSIHFFESQEYINLLELEQTEALFRIQYSITKEELSIAIANMKDLNFLVNKIYPVGDNYVIINIMISDAQDLSKKVEIYKEGDYVFAESDGIRNVYDILNSIEHPQVCFTYGISKIHQNSFVKKMKKNSYESKYSNEEIRRAIIKGLGLKEDATNEEAFEAIKNKLYSLTPIKDAGLLDKLKNLNELEFYETIASLDSLVCNLSAMLATGVDDELIYTFGYFSNDNEITSNEKHAWTMTETGEIIDVTPTELKEKDILISRILEYGMKYHIPTTLFIAFASYISYRLFGKRIKFFIAIKRLEHTLESEHFKEVYAEIKETMYGGIHVPVLRNLPETVKTINEEFNSLTLQELKDLRKELKQTLKKEDYRVSSELITQIPFVKEHQEEIQKIFQKKIYNDK